MRPRAEPASHSFGSSYQVRSRNRRILFGSPLDLRTRIAFPEAFCRCPSPQSPRAKAVARGGVCCSAVWSCLAGACDRRTEHTHKPLPHTHTHTRAHLITHDTLRCPAPTLRTDSQKSKMPEIGNTGVAFDTIAREWRCKYTGPAGESASLKVVSAHRTHFSHMSHPTFPTSHLLFPCF